MKEILKEYLNEPIIINGQKGYLFEVSEDYICVSYESTLLYDNNLEPISESLRDEIPIKAYYPYNSIIIRDFTSHLWITTIDSLITEQRAMIYNILQKIK